MPGWYVKHVLHLLQDSRALQFNTLMFSPSAVSLAARRWGVPAADNGLQPCPAKAPRASSSLSFPIATLT